MPGAPFVGTGEKPLAKGHGLRLLMNAKADFGPYTEEETAIVSLEAAERALAEISQWPGYVPSPLIRLDALASELGVGELLYKDESSRLGQDSFKALGGAYAATLKLRQVGSAGGVTLCCATDGNHGQSVALAARRHGCGCVVFMHARASLAKVAAIEGLGARVVRTAGNYDGSVMEAARAARQEGWILIADTGEDVHDQTTRHVMQGYGVMVLEILRQLRSAPPPTHVFLQAGVGGLAAAIAGPLAQRYGPDRPRAVVVEPVMAAPLFASARAGAPTAVGGSLATAMEMLSAGHVSPVAWPVLQRRIDAFMTIEDVEAPKARDRLLKSGAAAAGLDVGLSGIAGLAGLMRIVGDPGQALALNLDHRSRVLVFGTEAGPHPQGS